MKYQTQTLIVRILTAALVSIAMLATVQGVRAASHDRTERLMVSYKAFDAHKIQLAKLEQTAKKA